MKREISNERQLGSYIHDARIQAGMTQADLALRAGVSRKWLIGLEQGVRTRAELGKVFDTLRSLGLSMHFSSPTEESARESTPKDHGSHTSYPANISQPTIDAIRKVAGADSLLKSIGAISAQNQGALDAFRKGGGADSLLKSLGTISAQNQGALDAFRKGGGADSLLKSIGAISAQNQGALDAFRKGGGADSLLKSLGTISAQNQAASDIPRKADRLRDDTSDSLDGEDLSEEGSAE